MKAMKGYFTLSRLRSAIRIEVPPNIAVHFLQLLMRQFQESVDQAEFVHHLKRRGMHGVAAKIPEKIGVFFQHHVSMPARPSRYPSIMPAGPPPTMQQRV